MFKINSITILFEKNLAECVFALEQSTKNAFFRNVVSLCLDSIICLHYRSNNHCTNSSKSLTLPLVNECNIIQNNKLLLRLYYLE